MSGYRLRRYQKRVAQAVTTSVEERLGWSIVVMFPRQSGKNELQAQIECYLLAKFSQFGGEMVKISPTWKPQSLNAMRRLETALQRNPYTSRLWQKEHGYIYRLGTARISFLSGAPGSHIVGATARTLLACDEAQDVNMEKWDREVNPMAAAYNTTRVFWGTAWTKNTLLARELQLARDSQSRDGQQRVFTLTADEVAQEVPAYGLFVAEEVRRYGRQHPIVRSQYFSEVLDDEGSMFTAHRQVLMQGSHIPTAAPRPGVQYAVLVDVGGEDALNASELSETGRRDSTALTVVEVNLDGTGQYQVGAPGYRVVQRRLWTGQPHSMLLDEIAAICAQYQARHVVIDATGVGAGLASFLTRKLGSGRVLPFTFSSKSKSDLGWGFISVIETGRFKEFCRDAAGDREQTHLQDLFWQQARACQSQVLEGPGRQLRWGVPPGTRSVDGGFIHDDLLVSAALCSVLDRLSWGRSKSIVIPAQDPLAGYGNVY